MSHPGRDGALLGGLAGHEGHQGHTGRDAILGGIGGHEGNKIHEHHEDKKAAKAEAKAEEGPGMGQKIKDKLTGN